MGAFRRGLSLAEKGVDAAADKLKAAWQTYNGFRTDTMGAVKESGSDPVTIAEFIIGLWVIRESQRKDRNSWLEPHRFGNEVTIYRGGLLTPPELLRAQADHLAKLGGHKIVHFPPDTPFIGSLDELIPHTASLEDQARCILELLDRLDAEGVETFNFVTHSLGLNAVMMAINMASDPIRKKIGKVFAQSPATKGAPLSNGLPAMMTVLADQMRPGSEASKIVMKYARKYVDVVLASEMDTIVPLEYQLIDGDHKATQIIMKNWRHLTAVVDLPLSIRSTTEFTAMLVNALLNGTLDTKVLRVVSPSVRLATKNETMAFAA